MLFLVLDSVKSVAIWQFEGSLLKVWASNGRNEGVDVLYIYLYID